MRYGEIGLPVGSLVRTKLHKGSEHNGKLCKIVEGLKYRVILKDVAYLVDMKVEGYAQYMKVENIELVALPDKWAEWARDKVSQLLLPHHLISLQLSQEKQNGDFPYGN